MPASVFIAIRARNRRTHPVNICPTSTYTRSHVRTNRIFSPRTAPWNSPQNAVDPALPTSYAPSTTAQTRGAIQRLHSAPQSGIPARAYLL